MSPRRGAVVSVLKGADAVVLNDAVRKVVDGLVGDGDRSLMVEELDIETYAAGEGEVPEVDRLVNAAQTPPFLTDSRVVVARHAAVFSSADAVRPLVEYLGAPLDSTHLVLVWEKGPGQQKVAAIPKSLAAAIKAAGGDVVDTSPPSQAGKRGSWLDERMAASGVRLDAAARKMVAARLGEDVSRVGALVETLESTFGPGAKIGVDELTPYLGAAGGVAPWDLTDAIDQGDIPLAIDRLHRLLGAGERNAIGLMFTLHSHYERMLALDGAEVTSKEEAAQRLGINPFPAGKAWQQGRRLGSAGVRESIALLARADLDLRGLRAWPPELVLEVLVARLARRAKR